MILLKIERVKSYDTTKKLKCIKIHVNLKVFLFLVNLSSDVEDKLKIYRENFEKAYLEATEKFYKLKAPLYLEANGVQNYMRYADCKLKEEETRALRYLETGWGCNSVATVSVLKRFYATRPVLTICESF